MPARYQDIKYQTKLVTQLSIAKVVETILNT
jgi:hypothetical protein